MIQIRVAGEYLDLPTDFSLDIEESSPIFNDAGSQSIAVTLPATARNRKIFGFPARTDAINPEKMRGVRCRVFSGAYIRTGTINVDSASADSISINIGFDNSIAYDAWKAKKLSEVKSLPCYKIKSLPAFGAFLNELFQKGRPKEDDLAVFPICVARETIEEDEVETEYPEILNNVDELPPVYTIRYGGLNVLRIVDGELIQVSVPTGYGCTPFVKVWKILECVFADLGLTLESNPFKEDVQLARLVVLNNTADAVCNGTLDYSELMPDCTVEEFLHALFVRFGMVYLTDFDSQTVCIRFLKDIVRQSPALDMDASLDSPASFEYISPQYVRLSAASSMEGAAPLTERLEEFIRGFAVENVYVANDPVELNRGELPAELGTGQPQTLSSDGEENVFRIDTEAKGADISEYCVQIKRPEKPEKEGYRFTWDVGTGKWWRVGTFNGVYLKEQSTSFFTWDPAPEGYEPLDLNSTDEWCPLDYIGRPRKLMPAFLTGSRHFHTYLESDGDEESGDCPLSFMFAMTGMNGYGGTQGRLSADAAGGQGAYAFADGSSHDLSLFFQFRNGLYATFWRDYDMVIRNADRKVVVSGTMSKPELRNIDIFSPMGLGGVPMLLDTANIYIDDSLEGRFDMTLMPMMRHTEADEPPFASEVPDFPTALDVL